MQYILACRYSFFVHKVWCQQLLNTQQQQSLYTKLLEVRYMHLFLPFSSHKGHLLRKMKLYHILLNLFHSSLCRPPASPHCSINYHPITFSILIVPLTIIPSLFRIGTLDYPLLYMPKLHNWFSLILSSIGATSSNLNDTTCELFVVTIFMLV